MYKNLLALALTLFMSSTASADFIDLVYIKGQVGMALTTDGTIGNSKVDYDIAAPYPVNIGVGVYFSPLFSLALEINYETQDLEEIPDTVTNDEKKEVSGMLNLYFHLPSLLGIEPFVGIGAGFTKITIEENDYDTDGFIYNIGVGLDYKLSGFLNLVAEARIEDPIEDLKLDGAGSLDREDLDYTKAKFLVGLKLKF